MSPEDKIDKIGRAVLKARNRAEIASLKTLEGLMKRRIHNSGLKSDGTKMKPYSAMWSAVRQGAGKQVAYKDLQFTGDLRRNYTVGKNGKDNALGFLNFRARRKAVDIHEIEGGQVFSPTDGEVKRLIDSYVQVLIRNIRQNIKR